MQFQAAHAVQYIVLALLLMCLSSIARPVYGQTDAYSARLGDSNAPNRLVIYFSMGCSHCLEDFDKQSEAYEYYVNGGSLSIELVEISGIVDGHPDDDVREQATAQSILMSMIYACIVEERPDQALTYLRNFIQSAKVALNGSDLKWGRWPFATTDDINPDADSLFFDAKTDSPQMALAQHLFLESGATGERCNSAEDQERLQRNAFAHSDRFEQTGRRTLPLYVLNDQVVPRNQISRRLYETTKKRR